MRLDPVPDAPALRLELEADEVGGPVVALIVAELHVGVETAMSRAGAHVASGTERLAARLLALADEAGATRLVVAGDLKQSVPETTFQERREIPRFLATLAGALDVHIVLGNHDAGLRSLVPRHHDIVVLDAPGVRYGGISDDSGGSKGGVGVFHGHAWPGRDLLLADEWVSAHTHPVVALVDEMGHAHVERCWVRGDVRHRALAAHYGDAGNEAHVGAMTIVPPFNPLLGGAAINVDGLLGPAGKMLDVDAADVYLLDGTHLGRVGALPLPPESWRRRHRAPKDEDL